MFKIKMGQTPGDVGVGHKIRMMEGRVPEDEKRRAKGFRKDVRLRERATLKERTRKEIERALS